MTTFDAWRKIVLPAFLPAFLPSSARWGWPVFWPVFWPVGKAMTRDDIIRMARNAGLWVSDDGAITGGDNQFGLLDFAALAAAAEREACAKLCDGIKYSGYCPPEDGAAPDYYNSAAAECAAAIRARGEP